MNSLMLFLLLNIYTRLIISYNINDIINSAITMKGEFYDNGNLKKENASREKKFY